jgi:putative exporter of polyketide antibiotics
MNNSTFLNLNLSDFVKGLILAVLTSVLTIVYDVVQTGSLSFDWKHIGTAAITTAIAYLLKNLFTNSTGTLLKKEN